MEPSQLLVWAAAVACPIGMGVMMWLMSKNMGGEGGQAMSGGQPPADAAERLAALRAERQQLEAETAEVARLAELESRRDALVAAAKSGSPLGDEAGIQATPGPAD